MAECTCCWVRRILVLDLRQTGERKRKSVRECSVDANLSVLNLVIVKREKEIFLDWQTPLYQGSWGPKGLRRTCKLFNLSKEHDAPPVCCQKALEQRRLKHPKFSLVTWGVLQHKRWPIAVKKNEELAAEYANCWPRESRKPKKNSRNRLPRAAGCLH